MGRERLCKNPYRRRIIGSFGGRDMIMVNRKPWVVILKMLEDEEVERIGNLHRGKGQDH